MKIGILKETKMPPDRRVALTPKQVIELENNFENIKVIVQSSDIRCIDDENYRQEGCTVKNDISDCDILIGIKEVAINNLIQDKTYLFFAHVAKKQQYNRQLLQTILQKNIRLIDYEYLANENGRIIAFGRWAGIVGAYNAIRAIGIRYNLFDIKPAHKAENYNELKNILHKIKLPPLKIVLTGNGRVANGVVEVLTHLKIKQEKPFDFLSKPNIHPVYCRLEPEHYVTHKTNNNFSLEHFYEFPEEYISTFSPYTRVADVFISGHFWHPKSPYFITKKQLSDKKFNLKIIADISCDINAPIASTIRASKVIDPFYGYHTQKHQETDAFNENAITVMAVDNLPAELAIDASHDFGNMLINRVFPELFANNKSDIIKRATITENGKLTKLFNYLQKYAKGEE